MNYQRYASGVERRRAVLKTELEKANALRREAHLPQRNVELVVTETEPLMTQHEFDARAKAQQGFTRFRQRQLAKVDLPNPDSASDWQDYKADWQQHRAVAFRQAFLEHEIIVAWSNTSRLLTGPWRR